ncbi:MAG: hypothetical protein IKE14_10535 [Loktanella sp.]|jgi:NTP pyrophosphatase (non-canonical NTP hydrolase)|nr:hypothetical protein [Loktanella sp.]
MNDPRSIDALSDLSQAVSDIYAKRFGIDRNTVWHLAKLTEELGELQAAFLKRNGQGRTAQDVQALQTAMEDEVADLFAQILLFARWQNIDIPTAVARKWGKYLPSPARAEEE